MRKKQTGITAGVTDVADSNGMVGTTGITEMSGGGGIIGTGNVADTCDMAGAVGVEVTEKTPMRIDILTLFPESFAPLQTSIIGRAVESGTLKINIVNIRDFSKDRHKKCDDTPFGGGAGMLMTVQPIFDAINSLLSDEEKDLLKKEAERDVKNRKNKDSSVRIIFPSPIGQVLSAKKAEALSTFKHLIFVCGHYEGVDERLFQLFPIEKISIGDYVLTGGELPTMVIVDCLSRFVDGVISPESLENESFSNGLLEYPQYTKPRVFQGLSVPEVLLSGNHQEIDKWREAQSLKRTQVLRKDLLRKKK